MHSRIAGDNDVALQLNLEKRFGQELETEKSMIEQSLGTFEKHRRKQMDDLNKELKEGGSSRYLEMLETELTQLKALVAASDSTSRVSGNM
jgi:hypothetical protein